MLFLDFLYATSFPIYRSRAITAIPRSRRFPRSSSLSRLHLELLLPMDNKTIATIFYETADLMEVASEDSFRIRSYRRAAEALEGLTQQVAEIYQDEKALLAIPGIGKSMATNIRELI